MKDHEDEEGLSGPPKRKGNGAGQKPREPKDEFESVKAVRHHVDKIVAEGEQIGSSSEQIQALSHELLERNGPKVSGKSEEEIREYIAKELSKRGQHHSTISRQFLAGKWLHDHGFRPGEIKESVIRALRLRVLEDHQDDVLDQAFEKRGAYAKIQAKDITAIAKEQGVLKPKCGRKHEGAADPADVTETDNDSGTQGLSGDEKAGDNSQVADQTTETEDSNVPDTLDPAFSIITGNRRNIAPTVRFLEVCHVELELAAMIGGLSADQRWTLLGKLKRVTAQPKPQGGKRKPRRK